MSDVNPIIDDDDILPEPAPSASTRVSRAARRKAAKRRAIVIAIVAALVLAAVGVGAAYISSRPQPLDQRYVTVAAVSGDLSETLSFTGTVTESDQVSVSFPANGTVNGLKVSVGDHVTAGQALATMATKDLKQARDSAQANLDQAKLTLSQLSSSSSTGSSSSSSSSRSNTSSSSSSRTGSGGQGSGSGGQGSGQSGPDLSQMVADARAALATAQNAATQANLAMAAACKPLIDAANNPAPDPTDPTQPTPDPTDPTQPVSNPVVLTADQVKTCTDAMTAQTQANQGVSQAGDALSTLTQQLSDALVQAEIQCQARVLQAAQSAAQKTGQQLAQSLAQQYTGGSASSSQTQKVAAQIAVDQAQDALTQAQLNLDNATLTSPIDGVVAVLPWTVGASMTTSDAVVIVGDGGVYVTLSVPVAKIGQISVGQTATIEELGVAQATGKVSVKNLAPASAGGSTYAVTVAASGTDAKALLGGVTGQVTITTGQIPNAVLIPISAVTLDDTGVSGTVLVLGADAVNEVQVQVAGIGQTQVAVSQGISVGDKVVLADTQEAMPSSLSGIQRALSGGAGGTRVYVGGTGGGGQQPGAQPSR